jgi:hypothetical protein
MFFDPVVDAATGRTLTAEPKALLVDGDIELFRTFGS